MSMQPGPLKTYRAAGWHGCIRSDWAEHFQEHEPLGWLGDRPSEMVRDRAAAQTWCAETERGGLYVKHVRALKDHNTSGQGWWNHLRWSLGPPRALRAARVTRQLHDAGVHAPPVILAARRRRDGQIEELLVTEEVPNVSFGAALRQPAELGTDRAALLEMVGRSIAMLHRCGFTHGDLNPTNMLVSLDGLSLIYLDNERTRRWWPWPPRKLRRRNLAQLLYRLLPALGYRESRRFLESYWDAMDITGGRCRRERYVVLRWARRRFQERKRVFARHRRIAITPAAVRST